MKRIFNIRFLCRRGITLRGDGVRNNSNFTQIVHLELKTTLPFPRGWSRTPTSMPYTSRQMQNKMLTLMPLEVLTYVTASLHSSSFYSITAYETTDSYNREKVMIFLRWLDNSLNAREKFIRLQQVNIIDAATIIFHN